MKFVVRTLASVLLLLSVTAAVSTSGGQATPASAAPRAAPAQRLSILVIHGPNMNLLGRREPAIYGSMTLDQVNARISALAKELNVDVITVQSNSEGVIVDTLQKHMDDVAGAVINAAGLSFHSVPIHDAIKAMPFPVIEVHMSNLATRDEIHQHSILTPAVRGTVMGLGWRSYTAALRALVEMVRDPEQQR
jgi:3-dehydroquinate dehydratase-2